MSTSLIERQNWTIRGGLRRLTRLSNGFSHKRENLEASVALWFAYYDFVRIHETIRCTPAMEAGITDRVWSLAELVEAALAEPHGDAPTPEPLKPREGTNARQTTTGGWLRAVPGTAPQGDLFAWSASRPAEPPKPLPPIGTQLGLPFPGME